MSEDLAVRKNNIFLSKIMSQSSPAIDTMLQHYPEDVDINREQIEKLENPVRMMEKIHSLIKNLCDKLDQTFHLGIS